MARQATPSNQHQIESEVEPGEVRPGAEKCFGGARDAAALARCQRRRGHGDVPAGLDLDDREHPAAPGDNVDLARWAAPAARDNAPTTQPQMP